MKNKSGLVIRIILVLLMGATTVMTLLGAVGTTCLAWNGDKYGPPFRWIVPYMSTYQTLVYVSLAAGVAAAIVTYALIRGDKWFYLGALVTLVVAGGAASYQMYMTSSLRNIAFFAAAPTNMRLYITAATLIAFLFIRIPGLWNRGGFGGSSAGKGNWGTPTGLALMLIGVLMLSAPMWASPEHIVDGYNYVLTLQVPLILDGIALVLVGAALLLSRHLMVLLSSRRSIESVK